MNGIPRILRLSAGPAVIVTLLALWACGDREPTLPSFSAAASGGGGGVSVITTDPDSATQDTTLDVVVSGSGFDQGSQAQWAVASVPSAKVRTNSTRFVTSKKLVANISIALDADTGLYDVIVTTATGKKGIGTELFAVHQKSKNTPLTAVFRDALGDGVTSDARIRPGDATYVDGVDGVEAVILDNGNFKVSAKSPSPRKLCIDFGTQSPPTGLTQPECDNGYQASSNPDVAGRLPALAVGQAMTSASQVTWVTAGYNWFLRFGEDCAGSVVPANRVSITRLDASNWTVESPSGSAILCKLPVKGRPVTTFVGSFSMPFQLTLRLN